MYLLQKYTTFKIVRYTYVTGYTYIIHIDIYIYIYITMLDIHILQCIDFEIKIENKLCNLIVLYRLPSQSQIDNLELNIDAIAAKNPYIWLAF